MITALLSMLLLLLIGILWAVIQPAGLDVATVRRSITTLVYNLLLPALIISVMWRAPVGWGSVRIAVSAAGGVLAMTALAWLVTRVLKMPKQCAGAAILAAAYPNATYLGLPVLEASFGSWARSIAIQYDLLACTPLLLTLGVAIALHYGSGSRSEYQPFKTLLKVPPLWAMLLALCINGLQIQLPQTVVTVVDLLGACVVPLMLLSLGMSLCWQGGMQGYRISLAAVVLLQLFIHPLCVVLIAKLSGLQDTILAATIMESAMPCMVLGIVICDRYHLHTAFYAAAVTFSTLLSIISLPLWLHSLL